MTTDDTLRELGKLLPTDRPDVDRRESVRASLIAAASVPAAPSSKKWLFVGGGFLAGALAAAAIALVILRPATQAPAAHEAYARIESSSAAELEHTIVPTPTGTDELVHVKTGKVRLAVPATRTGDHVRVTTGNAEIEGTGAYEIVAVADKLESVTVSSGSATVRVTGQAQAVFLAAGQTWRAPVQTADLALTTTPDPALPPTAQPATPPPSSSTPNGSGGPPDLKPYPGTTPRAAAATKGQPIEDELDRPDYSKPWPGDPNGRPIRAPSAGEKRAPAPIVTCCADKPLKQTKIVEATSDDLEPTIRTNPATTNSGAPIETELETRQNPPPPQPAVAPSPTSPTSDVERHFRAGYALLRANKLADAITELGAAADAGDGPLAADARYYQAIALVKAKRGAEAERALVQFMDRAPTSIRRGRAAMMLGRLLADRGDAATAKQWFEVAAKDTDPTVAAAAKAALR